MDSDPAGDRDGRLILREHGDRRISRLEPGGGKKTLADSYRGKRFNSPNDLAVHSSGAIYFTDPPYGLPQGFDDPRRTLFITADSLLCSVWLATAGPLPGG